MTKNCRDLARYIPADVKREVRRACGFGCIRCGLPIVQYHHITPFPECDLHVPNEIALLCPTHHSQVDSGTVSNDSVKEWRKAPIARRQRRCRGADLFYLSHPLTLRVGSSSFPNLSCFVRTTDGDEWLSIGRATDGSDMVLLNATFYNPDGSRSLRILENVWECWTDEVWDLRFEGRKLRLWRDHRHEVLRLSAEPPHTLALERLDMRLGDHGVSVTGDGTATIHTPSGDVSTCGVTDRGGESVYYIS